MPYSADQFRDQLLALQPRGNALPTDIGTLWAQLLDALSVDLARLGNAADQLRREFLLTNTMHLLADWERVFGLPDDCAAEASVTLQQRRNSLVSKLIALGGQSRAYFIAVAAALGYTITITEFQPFRVGQSAVGDALTNGDWAFAWRVNAPNTTLTAFRVGLSAVGEPLSVWGNDRLECALTKVKPAHTTLQFAYS